MNDTTRLNAMQLCACIGPVGDCPCIRRARGEKVAITETHISASLFALLPEDDQNTINALKHKALEFLTLRKRQDKAAQPEAPAPLQYVLETCTRNHLFLTLPDHPKDAELRPYCPHCMLKDLEVAQDHRAATASGH